MMTKKIALLISVLVIGGGGLLVSMMIAEDEQVTAVAEPATQKPSPVKTSANQNSTGEFLNYDIIIGDKDAPIEIIEYAAISCSHCADFHKNVFPELKEKFLDTGKAKLVYRNFIFDNPFDVFASTLTRCVPEEKFESTVKTYFDYQNVWNKIPDLQRIFEENGRAAAISFAKSEVTKIANMSGMSSEEAQKCFENEGVINYLLKIRQTAVEQYEVKSTPTVIVDGKKLDRHDVAAIAEAIEAAGK